VIDDYRVEYPANRRELLDRLPKGAIAAEIGVYTGRFSEVILDRCEPRELHLIDPWAPTEEAIFRNIHPAVWDAIYGAMADRFHGTQVTLHRAPSGDALATFPDNYFDWVYVDADHAYNHARNDILAAGRVVRPGGFVAGHDWQIRGVQRAVLDALNSTRFKLRYLTSDHLPSYALEVVD
jgi:SAM-dependent methyltransferase